MRSGGDDNVAANTLALDALLLEDALVCRHRATATAQILSRARALGGTPVALGEVADAKAALVPARGGGARAEQVGPISPTIVLSGGGLYEHSVSRGRWQEVARPQPQANRLG